MKNLDPITKRIAVIGVLTRGILLFTSLFIFSLAGLNKSYALPHINTSLDDQAGQIMMAPYGTGSEEIVFIWNTATGKSVSWYYSKEVKKFVKSTPEYQLPVIVF